MDKVIKLESIAKFNALRGQETLHPLVNVFDQSKSKPLHAARFLSELYIVFLKELKCGELKYGRSNYDYQEGTLVFIAPGQVFGISEQTETIQPTGWALAFHPDLNYGGQVHRSNGKFHRTLKI